MNKSELVAGVKRHVSRKPRDIDSFTPLEPAEVALRLRRMARSLSSNPPRNANPAKLADRKRDIRALQRGVVDCLALDALKHPPAVEPATDKRKTKPLAFKPATLDFAPPAQGALVIRPSAQAMAKYDAALKAQEAAPSLPVSADALTIKPRS